MSELDDWFKLPKTPFRDSPIGAVMLELEKEHPNWTVQHLYHRARVVYSVKIGYNVVPANRRSIDEFF
jgi:hypothetical protein